MLGNILFKHSHYTPPQKTEDKHLSRNIRELFKNGLKESKVTK